MKSYEVKKCISPSTIPISHPRNSQPLTSVNGKHIQSFPLFSKGPCCKVREGESLAVLAGLEMNAPKKRCPSQSRSLSSPWNM